MVYLINAYECVWRKYPYFVIKLLVAISDSNLSVNISTFDSFTKSVSYKKWGWMYFVFVPNRSKISFTISRTLIMDWQLWLWLWKFPSFIIKLISAKIFFILIMTFLCSTFDFKHCNNEVFFTNINLFVLELLHCITCEWAMCN